MFFQANRMLRQIDELLKADDGPRSLIPFRHLKGNDTFERVHYMLASLLVIIGEQKNIIKEQKRTIDNLRTRIAARHVSSLRTSSDVKPDPKLDPGNGRNVRREADGSATVVHDFTNTAPAWYPSVERADPPAAIRSGGGGDYGGGGASASWSTDSSSSSGSSSSSSSDSGSSSSSSSD